MFNSQVGQQNTSLFGNAPTNLNPNQGFTNQNQQNTFQNPSSIQQSIFPSGGLFSQTQNSNQGNNLFGGASTPIKPAQPSLFGPQNNQQFPPKTGLFDNQNQNLFGGGNKSAPLGNNTGMSNLGLQGQSLFGQASANNNNQMSNIFGQPSTSTNTQNISLFGNSNLGMNTNLGSNPIQNNPIQLPSQQNSAFSTLASSANSLFPQTQAQSSSTFPANNPGSFLNNSNQIGVNNMGQNNFSNNRNMDMISNMVNNSNLGFHQQDSLGTSLLGKFISTKQQNTSENFHHYLFLPQFSKCGKSTEMIRIEDYALRKQGKLMFSPDPNGKLLSSNSVAFPQNPFPPNNQNANSNFGSLVNNMGLQNMNNNSQFNSGPGSFGVGIMNQNQSLFNQNQSNNASSMQGNNALGNLHGNPSSGNTSSLFGLSNPIPTQNTSLGAANNNSLFSNFNSNQNSNLLGQNNQKPNLNLGSNTTNPTGLFGNIGQNSLFSNNSNNTSSIFGNVGQQSQNNNNNNNAANSLNTQNKNLFGGLPNLGINTQQNQAPSSSIFGNSTQNTSINSVFTNQNQPNSLFGNSSNLFGTAPQNPQNALNVQNPNFGNSSGFSTNLFSNQPVGNFDNNEQKNLLNNGGQQPSYQIPRLQIPINPTKFVEKLFYSGQIKNPGSDFSLFQNQTVEFTQNPFGNYSGNISELEHISQYFEKSNQDSKKEESNKMKFSITELAKSLDTSYSNSNLVDPFPHSSFSTQKTSHVAQDYLSTKPNNPQVPTNKQSIFPSVHINKQVNIFQKDNSKLLSHKKNEGHSSILLSKPSQKSQFSYEKNSDILNLLVHVFLDNDKVDINITVNKRRHIEEMYNIILAQLGEKAKMIQDRKYIFHSKGIRLKNNITFEEEKIRNNQEISMNFSLKGLESKKKDNEVSREVQESNFEKNQNENSQNYSVNSNDLLNNSSVPKANNGSYGFVPINLLPKLTKPNYYIRPSLLEISRMNLQEIQSIPGLVIGNENGEIEYTTPTDLLEVNIDNILNINSHEIELYSGNVKHERGTKLNKEAICTLKNFDVYEIMENVEDLEAIDQLKKQCNDMNTIFKSYDHQKKEFKFKVEHF